MFTPYSWITYDGDGTTATFGVPFPYVAREHVHVYIGWDPSTRSFTSELEHGVGFTFASGNEITTTVAPGALEELTVLRITPIGEQLTDWQTGSPPTARELDVADRQVLYAVQEFIDQTLQAREDLDTAVLVGSGVVLVDNLNSLLTNAALTANQGRALRLLIEAVEALVVAAQTDADAAGVAAAAAQADADAAGAAAGTAQSAATGANSAAAAAQSTANAALAAGSPPSTVAFVARNTAPTGWLKANGAAVSRTTYADLFAAIGTAFGAGNGTTTFNLPDLRGEFVRGWDDGRGIDTGRVFGSAQAELVINHTHNITGFTGASNGTGGAHFYNTNQFNTTGASTSVQTPAGGSETRPRNVALLAIIKF